MLNKFLAFIANSLYFVSAKVNKFRKKFPNAKILIACATKARKLQGDEEPQYNYGWSFARRSTLILTDAGLYCGDWEIPLNTIQEATLFKLSYGAVLKIKASDGLNYQFGMQTDSSWENQNVLPLKVEKRSLGFSTPALIVRVLVTALFVYFVVQDFVTQNISLVTIVEIAMIIYVANPIVAMYKNRS